MMLKVRLMGLVVVVFVFCLVIMLLTTTDNINCEPVVAIKKNNFQPVMLLTVSGKPVVASPNDSAKMSNFNQKKAVRVISKKIMAKTEKPLLLPIIKKKPLLPQWTSYKVVALVTAYCPCQRCCGHFANGKTSTRTNAWRRGIASDPSVVPYGSIAEIPGYGVARVDDTGSAMRRSWRRKGLIHLDLRFQYHWQARKWGAKIMQVTLKPAPAKLKTR